MKSIDHGDTLRSVLAAAELSILDQHFRLREDGEAWDGNKPRAELTFGYVDNNRFKTMTSINFPCLGDALEMLANHDRLATMVDLGVSVMPEAHRPQVPAWLKAKSTAEDVRAQMKRSRRLAKQATGSPANDDDGPCVF